eukprot:TRINITY_DN7392_c0_g1_i5.p2 TRINITY_DN7392_c0_g1~~TRINITY_DN7392_c0_g1_i5.p2  ORF type:complete len:192 (-),score=35.94 TRINITY_DN7392_c0_g1_i5:48-623(-)
MIQRLSAQGAADPSTPLAAPSVLRSSTSLLQPGMLGLVVEGLDETEGLDDQRWLENEIARALSHNMFGTFALPASPSLASNTSTPRRRTRTNPSQSSGSSGSSVERHAPLAAGLGGSGSTTSPQRPKRPASESLQIPVPQAQPSSQAHSQPVTSRSLRMKYYLALTKDARAANARQSGTPPPSAQADDTLD